MASININGVTVSGTSIVVRNGKVIVDGKDVTLADVKEINVTITGNVDKLEVDACQTISVKGDVGNVKTLSGTVTITGDVKGSVQTMSGDVDCEGSITGSISTMSGNVKHRK